MLKGTSPKVHDVDQKNNQKSKNPSHVRKLNFGESILTLNTVKQFQGQKDGRLLIDKNVATIPCTAKIDFVRKWIESHEECVLNSNNDLQLSPTLGSSMTKRVESSPVFGNRRKRVRKKTSLNDTLINNDDRSRFSELSIKEISSPSIGCNKRIKIDTNSSKENIRKRLFQTSNMIASPVLDRKRYGYKRRRKKLNHESVRRSVLEQIENKHVETNVKSTCVDRGMSGQIQSPVLIKNCHYSSRKRERKSSQTLHLPFSDRAQNNYVDSNMNSVESYNLPPSQYPEIKFKIMCTQKQRQLIKRLEDSLKEDDVESSTSKDSKVSKEMVESNSTTPKSKLHIEDSPRNVKDTVKIEVESSKSDDDNCNDITNTSSDDTNANLSDLIEDTDIQDVECAIKNRDEKRDFHVVVSKPGSFTSQMTKSSDQTFFEKAEHVRHALPEERSSQKISQVSTQVNDVTDNKSSQSGIVISTETSPGKTYADPTVQLNLLDSGKKRKKPKRGSLSERLQSTINRQLSFVRVWRYQLKQIDKDNVSVPRVTVRLLAYVTRFGRQFLEGIVIEDPSQLLFQSLDTNNSPKSIKIMTIPNIVGKVEMKSKGTVQIFPPWQILDDEKLIIQVTYIRVVPNNEENAGHKINLDRVKKPIVEEFRCPCIDANRVIASCIDRSNKPNVIEKLFND